MSSLRLASYVQRTAPWPVVGGQGSEGSEAPRPQTPSFFRFSDSLPEPGGRVEAVGAAGCLGSPESLKGDPS